MPIDADEVLRIAALAQLDLDRPTVERFREQLQAILAYVALLDSAKVEGTAPTAHPSGTSQPLRPDEPTGSLPPEKALEGAPDPGAGFFRVPRVLSE